MGHKHLTIMTFSSMLKTFTIIFLCLNLSVAVAQKKKKKGAPDAPKKEKSDIKKISEVTKKCKKIEGLFPIYQDTTDGSLKIIVNKEQLGKEFIYFSQIADGVVEARAFRGSYRGSKVFKIEKYYNKIEFINQNTSYYFDPNNEISKSSSANISEGVIASLKIEAQDEKSGLYLIDADALFLKETFSQIKPPRFPKQSPMAFTLGNLDKDKTKTLGIRNYPKNTDLAIQYVYSKPSVLNKGSQAVTDGRNVSIKVYHSLIEMPENNYKSLIDDPRVGYFTTQVTDMTSKEVVPYRDLVHRWNLEKKDPNAAISEPVEPIVWWMENTTPKELRPIIKSAGERWNLAFEKAGFKNAIVIKQQPDDADWDAGDIRYNVLRWTSSPFPPFGGYGPSFVNPRTGQILGADIMLEYVALTNRLKSEKLFEKAGLDLLENNEVIPFSNDKYCCNAAEYGQLNNMFGKTSLMALGETKMEESKMINEYLHYLILHEMGHTLGLNHNMKSSQLHSLADIHNEEKTKKIGLIGSVMDYPSVNISLDREKQGQYWSTTPGPYDYWAIQFAYEPRKTKEETDKLLAKSTRPELTFGNDADDMRSPGKGIDPRVNIGDLTSDAIEYAIERVELSRKVAKGVLSRYQKENQGETYQVARTAYLTLTNQQARAATVLSRYIGGVYVDRAFIGQEGGTKPLIPVELEKQKKAMAALGKYVFAPDAFAAPNELYNYLQKQRRGFNLGRTPEDPKIHARTMLIQRATLMHILHYNTLQRINDTELYGNEYGLPKMMTDLNEVIFKEDIAGSVNTFRQNLQITYTKMLIDIASGPTSKKYVPVAKSMAIYNLKTIYKLTTAKTGNISTKAHKEHLNTLINNALKEIK